MGSRRRAGARIALRQHAVQLDHARIGDHDIGKLPQHAAVRRLVLRDSLAQLPHDTSKQSHQPRRESVVERRGHHRDSGRSLIHPTKSGQRAFASRAKAQGQRPYHRHRVYLSATAHHAALTGQCIQPRAQQKTGQRLANPNRLRSGHGYLPASVEASQLQSDQRPWPASTPCFSLHHAANRTRIRRLEGPAVCRRPAAGPADGRA